MKTPTISSAELVDGTEEELQAKIDELADKIGEAVEEGDHETAREYRNEIEEVLADEAGAEEAVVFGEHTTVGNMNLLGRTISAEEGEAIIALRVKE